MSEPRATHPTSLLPSTLAAGEEYASVSAILECDDLPQATLHIPYWRVAGKPAAIRVRGLSLDEREQVQRAGRLANGQTDLAAQYCLTWQLGCVLPRFTAEQADALRRKNAHAVEQGALFIWTLSALDQGWIDHVVQQQTGAEPAPPPDDERAADDSESAPRVRRVA